MRRVVVGVDGSEGGARALRWAARQAKARGWQLEAVMAWGYLDQRHVDLQAPFDPGYTVDDAVAALDHHLQEVLGAAATDVVRHTPCETAAVALLAVAETADLLVVGARGLGGFKGMLVGSVSQQCLRHAPCSIAIVRDDEVHEAPGRIVAAVDGSDNARVALRWAAAHARATGARLEVVHAWHLPYVTGLPFVYAPIDIDVIRRAAQGVLDQAVATIADIPLEAPVERILVEGTAAQVILDVAKGADTVVLGARGLGGFAGLLLGSVSHQVALHASCPAVVVPFHG